MKQRQQAMQMHSDCRRASLSSQAHSSHCHQVMEDSCHEAHAIGASV